MLQAKSLPHKADLLNRLEETLYTLFNDPSSDIYNPSLAEQPLETAVSIVAYDYFADIYSEDQQALVVQIEAILRHANADAFYRIVYDKTPEIYRQHLKRESPEEAIYIAAYDYFVNTYTKEQQTPGILMQRIIQSARTQQTSSEEAVIDSISQLVTLSTSNDILRKRLEDSKNVYLKVSYILYFNIIVFLTIGFLTMFDFQGFELSPLLLGILVGLATLFLTLPILDFISKKIKEVKSRQVTDQFIAEAGPLFQFIETDIFSRLRKKVKHD